MYLTGDGVTNKETKTSTEAWWPIGSSLNHESRITTDNANFNSGHWHWNRVPQIGTKKFDLIYYITENGLRCASGPVPSNNVETTVHFLLSSLE